MIHASPRNPAAASTAAATMPPKPDLRHAFGRFPTGIAVVTMLDGEGMPYGATINSFVSVSMAPPMISWNVVRGSLAHSTVSQARRFVINVLAKDQRSLAQKMTGPVAERFTDVQYRPSEWGLPVIDGTLAAFECNVHSMVTAGDHDIVLGIIDHFEHREGRPLVYWQGAYATAAQYDTQG
ncbi:flavin reductase family protein [Eoetvoesiella caeni]|nr:flavin reductase family protein [Eoetvoesiella caeni]MCI2808266.1 flavin reductase family protein [Eoetvoesiella caeni]NYT53731.1 flavin reductase family protein [Eoetvoesiella caeni]